MVEYIGYIVQQAYFGNTIQAYLEALGIVLASLIVGKIVYFFTNRYLKALTAKTETRLDDLLIDAIEEPLVVLIFTLGMHLAMQTIVVPENIVNTANGAVTTLAIMAVAWFAIRIIDIGIREYLLPLAKKSDNQLDDQLIPLLSKGMKVSVVVVAVLVALSNFGVDITALVAGLGIGGLAFALASKDTVENMFGAFAILFDKPFMVGDRITVEGVSGDVQEVGLRSTRIITLDHTELYIPNSKIVTGKLENISRPTKALAVSMTLQLTYETPTAKLREAMDIVRASIAGTPGVSPEYTPDVGFSEFAESSLNIFVKYWVDDFGKRLGVKDQVNQKIKGGFEKAGIEFAYPTKRIILAK